MKKTNTNIDILKTIKKLSREDELFDENGWKEVDKKFKNKKKYKRNKKYKKIDLDEPEI